MWKLCYHFSVIFKNKGIEEWDVIMGLFLGNDPKILIIKGRNWLGNDNEQQKQKTKKKSACDREQRGPMVLEGTLILGFMPKLWLWFLGNENVEEIIPQFFIILLFPYFFYKTKLSNYVIILLISIPHIFGQWLSYCYTYILFFLYRKINQNIYIYSNILLIFNHWSLTKLFYVCSSPITYKLRHLLYL